MLADVLLDGPRDKEPQTATFGSPAPYVGCCDLNAGHGYQLNARADRRIESSRKVFQRPMAEGVQLLNTIQDVFLDDTITVA